MPIHDIHTGGLLPHEEDSRDFQLGALFGTQPYIPKNQRLVIPTLSVKNQGRLNTCGWCASTVQKEIDERNILAVRGLVQRGLREGEVTQDGFSSLRGNQRMIQKYGIPEEVVMAPLEGSGWPEYSKDVLTAEVIENAAKHKSSSYFQARTKDEILRFLDQERPLETGIDWFAEYNMGGGFDAPWIIEALGENLVGGHAFVCIGYDLNYHGKKVFVFQQSAGPAWGDKGKFYIEMNFALLHCYAFYGQIDIPVDIASFLNAHQFDFVKGSSPACYQILGDKKYPFPDEATMITWTPDFIQSL